ncbi:MAG: hypothetical protein P1V97_12095 [Planctomycetota bacterium]|nr:hypothetical protein [Planctomycetota bacterium]
MSYQIFLNPIRDAVLPSPSPASAGREFLRQVARAYFQRLEDLCKEQHISLAGAIDDQDLFDSLLEQSRRYTAHTLRERFIEAALKAVIAEHPDYEGKRDELERMFRGERLELNVPPPIQSRPLLSSLSLCSSAGALIGSVLVFLLFRMGFKAPPEASLFWGLLAGVPFGTYLVTRIIFEIENAGGSLQSLSPFEFAKLTLIRKNRGLALLLFLPRLAIAGLVRSLSEYENVFDERGHKRAVVRSIEQWLCAASPIFAGLCQSKKAVEPEETKEHQKFTVQLGEKLLRLQQARFEELPVVSTELLNVARSLGFELPSDTKFSLKKLPKIIEANVAATNDSLLIVEPGASKSEIEDTANDCSETGADSEDPSESESEPEETGIRPWDSAMARFYRRYDYIDDGDLVQVVEKPVQLNGALHKKGLVRRYWGDEAELKVEVGS